MNDRTFAAQTRSTFQERRAWFDAFYERFNVGLRHAPDYGVRFTCPCCGYPTLYERRGHEICRLCQWQDDGQDDPCADEVYGAPNYDYSLTEARQNFDRFLAMYRPDNDPRIGGPDSATTLAAKQEIIRAFDSMIGAEEPTRVQLWTVVDQHLRVLLHESRRRGKEHE
jgi:hypothetical protein